MGDFRVVSYSDEPPRPIGDSDAAAYAVADAAHALDEAVQKVARAASLAACAYGMAEAIARQSDVDVVLNSESVQLAIEAVEDHPRTAAEIMARARFQTTVLRHACSAVFESAYALFQATELVESSEFEASRAQCTLAMTLSSNASYIAEEVLVEWGQSEED